MAKAISLLLLLAMIAHIIRPLGLPGLRRRGDFWKIALLAIFVMMLTVLIRPN
jgi:ABC-type branched-subunit amino acid transport system permease subunit